MRGDYWLKYISVFVLAVFLFCCFSQIISAKMEPISGEDVKALQNKISSSTNSLFGKIAKATKNISVVAPFFENVGARFSSWWLDQARPWIWKQWNYLNLYLDQEIRIE